MRQDFCATEPVLSGLLCKEMGRGWLTEASAIVGIPTSAIAALVPDHRHSTLRRYFLPVFL